ncbi:MAG: DUF6356 family protein [Pseudomonadota bacterium]
MRVFTEHPEAVGETYTQHMGSAFRFSADMFVSSICCFIHGIFPFLFVTTGRECVKRLHRRMVTHRHRDHDSSNTVPAE